VSAPGKTHKTAVVVIPPDDVWGPIQQIRQQHDSKIRRWMPHITMIYPFCPEAEFARMAEEVAAASSRSNVTAAIGVTLSRFETFSHGKGRYTVWLKPEPTKPLLDLYTALRTAVSYESDFEPRIGRFVPHLSVGQVRGKAKRDRLVADLQTAWKPIQFRVSEVHFILRGDPPDDIFRVIQTISFGGAATD
jgi:2'-5' RNA ligase